jgi:hypothetical protein
VTYPQKYRIQGSKALGVDEAHIIEMHLENLWKQRLI